AYRHLHGLRPHHPRAVGQIGDQVVDRQPLLPFHQRGAHLQAIGETRGAHVLHVQVDDGPQVTRIDHLLQVEVDGAHQLPARGFEVAQVVAMPDHLGQVDIGECDFAGDLCADVGVLAHRRGFYPRAVPDDPPPRTRRKINTGDRHNMPSTSRTCMPARRRLSYNMRKCEMPSVGYDTRVSSQRNVRPRHTSFTSSSTSKSMRVPTPSTSTTSSTVFTGYSRNPHIESRTRLKDSVCSHTSA